jgi:predicted restriction endonuclease
MIDIRYQDVNRCPFCILRKNKNLLQLIAEGSFLQPFWVRQRLTIALLAGYLIE